MTFVTLSNDIHTQVACFKFLTRLAYNSWQRTQRRWLTALNCNCCNILKEPMNEPLLQWQQQVKFTPRKDCDFHMKT